MKQVVQSLRSGVLRTVSAPDPLPVSGSVLIAAKASLISAGTEKYVTELGRKTLIGKALARPDHVRRVLEKAGQEGFGNTLSQVRAKLDEPMALGYSGAGVVLQCGRGISGLQPGARVAFAGPHSSTVSMGANLCAVIPDTVDFETAAYTGVAAIALEGVRLARVSLGGCVLVIGLGLLGQITVALLKAQGCRVFGSDVDPTRVTLAEAMGLDEGGAPGDLDAIKRFSRGYGVDATIITATTDSNGPVELAAEACRTRGRIVLVGVAGLNIPRPPFFQKELEFTVSSSLGPGRGDPQYEEKGIDYPIGHARWTAKRNMEAVLDLMAGGRLPVGQLTTHRFDIDDAPKAYDLIANGPGPRLGVVLRYPDLEGGALVRRLDVGDRSARAAGNVGVGLVGAGNFARLVLMPALAGISEVQLRGICTARGLNAQYTGEKYGFAFATTSIDEVLHDQATTAVFIATRHDMHADLVIAALQAGKAVFVEKPLCITPEQLQAISDCVAELGDRCPVLMVGFNRRFAGATQHLKKHFDGIVPISVAYRFAAGEIPANAWPQDMDVGGGRIIGEACHAIDLCSAVVGSVPVRVYAESVAPVGGVETTDDRVFISIRHANGGISNISYQAGGDRSGPTERIEVFGGSRTGVVDGWNTVEMWTRGRKAKFRGGKDKGHLAGFRVFVAACRDGGNWPVSWESIHATTWASLAAVESLRTGLPVVSDRASAV